MATAIAPRYRPDIDGLRAIAVLAVVACHVAPGRLAGGFAGVDVFFVISGYLITGLLLAQPGSMAALASFYVRRMRRIFPALALVCAACWLYGWFALFADEYRALGRHLAGSAAFAQNLLLWGEDGYFDDASAAKPLLHLWSLAIEEQFYLVWPLLLWGALRLRLRPALWIAVLAVLSFGYNVLAPQALEAAAFFSPFARAWELLAGALLACAQRDGTLVQTKIAASGDASRWRDTASVCGLALIVIRLAGGSGEGHAGALTVLAPVAGTVLLIAAGPAAWVNRRLLAQRALVWVGLVSYPLYLWHWPLLSYAYIQQSGQPPPAVRVALAVLALGLAALTWRYVERPLRSGGHGGRKALGLAGAVVAVGIAGCTNILTDGWPGRAALKGIAQTDVAREFIPPLRADSACRVFSGNVDLQFCRYREAGGLAVVAVIGDSHALAAFEGIAGALAAHGVNTLLLGSSGCAPLSGAAQGADVATRARCAGETAYALAVVRARPEIRHVFLLSRGPCYLAPTAGAADDCRESQGRIPAAAFAAGLQATVDGLVAAGKQVIYVAENPQLARPLRLCVPRPLRHTVLSCEAPLAAIRARYRQYQAAIGELRRVTVVDTFDAFCRGGSCGPYAPDGHLLYRDEDHLSVSGSDYQARTVLAPSIAAIVAVVDGVRRQDGAVR